MERRNFLATACFAASLLAGCAFGAKKHFDAKIENEDDSTHSLDITVKLPEGLASSEEPVWKESFQLDPGEKKQTQDAFAIGVEDDFIIRLWCTLDDKSTHRAKYFTEEDTVKIRIADNETVEFLNGYRWTPTPTPPTPTAAPEPDTPHK